jgi:D-3-phosphoglycerate dehydrogenase
MHTILITTSSFSQFDADMHRTCALLELQPVMNPYGRKLSESEVAALIVQHNPVGMIAGVEPLTRTVLEKAANLKVISRCGIGMDSIDLAAAHELGIVVTNTPDAPTVAVAELTLGLILGLQRRIHRSDARIRQGDWHRPMGNLLHGKTIGLIGCGRIGLYLTRLLAPFGALVLGCDPACCQPEYCTLVDVDELLARSDIISLHIPYSHENHHFMNSGRIGRMKKGAVLVNAARGGLVDEEALYAALASGRLGGAALDCFEQEPYAGRLKELDSVLLTGHIGSYAEEARSMMERQALDNLLDVLKRARDDSHSTKE